VQERATKLRHTAATTLKERIQGDLTTAMRERDDVTVATLRMALAAITNAEVAGKEHVTLDDDAIVGVLRSEMRKRSDARSRARKPAVSPGTRRWAW
jgi:uncharacterized protein YqeY